MGEMTRRPVQEGEAVRFGDVFAWTSKKTGVVHSLSMFIRFRRKDEQHPDCWVGLDIAWTSGPYPMRLSEALVPLLENPLDEYRWERVL